jgi:hypothetical protein
MTAGEATEASRSALVSAEMPGELKDSAATVRSPTVLRELLMVWEECHEFLLLSPTRSGTSMSSLCGPGKSMRYVIPARLAGGIRCDRSNVRTPVFSLEALVSDAQRSHLVAAAMTRLRGIFFDEVHTMREWRDFHICCADSMPLLRNKNLLVPLAGLTETAAPEPCVELQKAART